MTGKELNIAIYHELERLARDYFTEIEYMIPPGSYTAKQIYEVVGDAIGRFKKVIVKVGSFSAVMPEDYLFEALCEFEKLLRIREKDKVRFIRMEKRQRKSDVALEYRLCRIA